MTLLPDRLHARHNSARNFSFFHPHRSITANWMTVGEYASTPTLQNLRRHSCIDDAHLPMTVSFDGIAVSQQAVADSTSTMPRSRAPCRTASWEAGRLLPRVQSAPALRCGRRTALWRRPISSPRRRLVMTVCLTCAWKADCKSPDSLSLTATTMRLTAAISSVEPSPHRTRTGGVFGLRGLPAELSHVTSP